MSSEEETLVSRRALLRGTSVVGGGLFMAFNLNHPLTLAAMKSETAVIFNSEQWRSVKAASGRIIPTDHQPGAIEADCVNFIDKALANEEAEARPDFIAGLTGLDRMCDQNWGSTFAGLTADRQDQVLSSLEDDTATPWPGSGPAASVFFELLRSMTIMGFMADPKYGGNADLAGWRVARYPGPRHHKGGYTPAQMVGEEAIVTLWGDKM
jgi:gluconate 2-dehydrogenase gamma chain